MLAREHRTFLLRLWRNSDTQRWRVTLRHARTGDLHHFADLSQLVAFLEQPATSAESPHQADPTRCETQP